jgi:putative spermidine/putrescine transport system substrate-binding protein
MKELSSYVADFPTSSGKMSQLMLQGDAWIGVNGMSEFQELVEKGAPLKFVIPKEGTIASIETVGVVKNCPHPKLAQHFLNKLISPSGQAQMAYALSWKPLNRKVPITEKIQSRLPIDLTKPANLKKIDFEVIMKNRDAWTERFNKEVVSK